MKFPLGWGPAPEANLVTKRSFFGSPKSCFILVSMINPIPCYILILSKRFSKMYTVVYSHSTTRSQSFVGEGATVAFKLNKGQQKTARRLDLLKPNLCICIPQWYESRENTERAVSYYHFWSHSKSARERVLWLITLWWDLRNRLYIFLT